MAKRVDPLKAKEAKQKKIAIGGAVLLLAVLAYQGPKTLKMLKGPQPVAAPAATTPAPGTVTTGTVGAGAVPVLDAAPPPDLAAVADSDLSPAVEQGQLATFERFSSKDPFAQQAKPVVASAAPTAEAPPASTGTSTETSAPPAQSSGGAAAPAAGSTSTGSSPDAGFTTDRSGDEPAAIAAATSISVNGVAEDVAVEGAFPKDEPTFVLVKLAKNGKSVQIGIAGGEYASGGETITLGLGKKLTLQNTADGSRYELKLLAIQGYPVPKK